MNKKSLLAMAAAAALMAGCAEKAQQDTSATKMQRVSSVSVKAKHSCKGKVTAKNADQAASN